MTSRRLVLLAWAAAAASVAVPVWAQAQDFKPRIVRLGYALSDQSSQGRAVNFFAEQVDTASGGKMKIRALGAAVLGPEAQMLRAVAGGAQEMMVGSTSALAAISKEMAILDTPFLFNSAKEAEAVVDGPLGTRLMARLPDKGLVGLAYWGSPYTAILSGKAFDGPQGLSPTDLAYSPWVVTVSKIWWDRLSRPEQQVLQAAGRATRDFERQTAHAEAARTLADRKARGMAMAEVPVAEVARVREQLTRAYATTAAQVGMDFWQATQAELAALRAAKK